MKLHKSLLLFGLGLLLLTACDNDGSSDDTTEAGELTEDVSSSGLIEKAKEESENSEIPGPIEFTYGVEDNTSYGDDDNYMDIDGFSYGADQVIVIFNDTVIDVIPTKSDGSFNYYSKGSDNKVPITFATNSNAEIGDTFLPGESENEVVIAFIPNEEDDEVLSVGETAIYSSGIEITVTYVDLTDEKPNGEISGSFVRADFTIDNQSSEPFDFNGHYVELYDGERNKTESNAKNWYSDSIAAGMKGSGSVYFDSITEGPFTIIIGAATWVTE